MSSVNENKQKKNEISCILFLKNIGNKGILKSIFNITHSKYYTENGGFMKRLKKINILWKIRILSLQHIILPTAVIAAAFLLLNIIDFDSVFSPTLYKNSFDAYSAYTKGSNNVTVTIETLKYTGYNIMKGEKVVSVYYYDLSSERCMFYKLDMNYDSIKDIPKILNNVTISARLKELDGLTKTMMESFVQSIGWTYDALMSVTFPVIMDEQEYNPDFYYILYGFIIVCIFYSLYLTAANLILIIAPYLHPAYVKIKPYYKDIPYFQMIDLINDEFEENILVMSGPMYITESFFINLGRHEVSIMPLAQVALAYEHGELLSFFGIHLKINHTLHLRGFQNIRILASRQQSTNVTTIVDYIRENYPNIIWGHTKENIKAYKQILATEKAMEKTVREDKKSYKTKKRKAR